MRTLLALLALSSALLSAQQTFAQDDKIEEIGKSPVETEFAPGGRVRLDLCPSKSELIGRDDSMLRVSFRPERDDVRVRFQVSGDRADIRVSDCPQQFPDKNRDSQVIGALRPHDGRPARRARHYR